MAKSPKNRNKPGAGAARARSRWKIWLGLGALVVVLLVCLIYGFWASSFDMREVQEMSERSTVFDMDGKALFTRIEARPPGHRPAFHDAVEFEAQVVMQPPGRMLLNHKGISATLRLAAARPGGDAELAFLPVVLKRHGGLVLLLLRQIT